MRLLGIDYGTKRIGLALSDKTGKFAFPEAVTGTIDDIKKLCQEKDVEKIVLGKPEGYKGDASKILKRIAEFKLELERTIGLPVVYENEVLTTQQAKRITGKTKKTDASSAAIILQTYLDREISQEN